ncbi:MAG: hypothetical protein LC131_15470 [Anaerolineae bacterium]|nr:hypothetical protein [Anaerolineae bacterium]
MAQVTSSHPRQDFSVFAKNEAVTVGQTGNTALIEVDTSCIENLAVEAVVTGQNLDAFVVQGKVHPESTYVTLASATADYTTPNSPIIRASGDLTGITAGATGWFLMDVRPFYSVKVLASSGNVAGSTVTARAIGR